MAIFNYENFEKNLPDAFRKDKDSNNYKLLLVDKHIYDKIDAMFQSIYRILDIDNATGKTLDWYGTRLNLKRGTLTDAQYLIRLKAKIAQSFSDGSRDSVAKALAFVLSSTPDKIKLKSLGNNTVQIMDLPMTVLSEARISGEEITAIVKDMLPQGISVKAEFGGTFEFARNDGEYDANSGFADINGTVGGYFGLLGV